MSGEETKTCAPEGGDGPERERTQEWSVFQLIDHQVRQRILNLIRPTIGDEVMLLDIAGNRDEEALVELFTKYFNFEITYSLILASAIVGFRGTVYVTSFFVLLPLLIRQH